MGFLSLPIHASRGGPNLGPVSASSMPNRVSDMKLRQLKIGELVLLVLIAGLLCQVARIVAWGWEGALYGVPRISSVHPGATRAFERGQ